MRPICLRLLSSSIDFRLVIESMASSECTVEEDSKLFQEYFVNSLEMEAAKQDYCETEEGFRWTPNNVHIFLNAVKNLKSELRDPKIKKRDIWKRIKEDMVLNGIKGVDVVAIERKFRNMKATYKSIKDKDTTGRGIVAWEFYDDMQTILEEDTTINLRRTFTSSNVTDVFAEGFHWSPKNTNIFLNAVKNVKSELRDPKSSKREIWKRIKADMVLNGIKDIDEPTIERKFRNMKGTYRSLKGTTARGTVKWKYYDDMETICEEGKTINVGRTLSSTSKLKAQRGVQLYGLRKKQLNIEEERIAELKLLRQAVERNNEVQEERNELLKTYMENMRS